MKQLRLSIIGFGVVGRGLAQLLIEKNTHLRQMYNLGISVVSVATAHSGFIYREAGLDLPLLLELSTSGRSLTEHPNVQHWSSALDGLKATQADALAEATGTNLIDAEPGIGHIRMALSQKMHVVTANKGPLALAARELFTLAHNQGVQLRIESTVMAGSPVISTLKEGLAGTTVTAVRGILNGTTNYILSAMASGRDYTEVLKEAQAAGYAEADPTADVEGYDALAKTLILSEVAFQRPLKLDQVARKGITDISRGQIQRALDEGKRMKLVATLSLPKDGSVTSPLEARVVPVALPLSDPLAWVNGVLNAISIQTDTLQELTIIGPGAGSKETGQGLLSDLIAVSQSR